VPQRGHGTRKKEKETEEIDVGSPRGISPRPRFRQLKIKL